MNNSFGISLSALTQEDKTTDIWITLEQQYIPPIMTNANLSDVDAMLALARSGTSAREYTKTDCPVTLVTNNTAEVPLVFYVWPHSLDMVYSLSSDVGTISEKKHIELPREFDLVVEMADKVQLPYIFEGTYAWISDCIDDFGYIVSPPEIELVGTELQLSSEVFGVLRLSGNVIGYEYTVTMLFENTYIPDDVTDVDSDTTSTQPPGSNISSWFEGVTSRDLSPHIMDITSYGFPPRGVVSSISENVSDVVVAEDTGGDEEFSSVSNLTNSILCTWNDEDEVKTLSLPLTIPECVLDTLKACPNDDSWTGRLIAEPNQDYWIVYYSACNGQILGRKRVTV